MTIELRYYQGFGNNLFQYAFARLLATSMQRELVCVPQRGTSANWSQLFADARQHLEGRRIARPRIMWTQRSRPAWDGHGLSLDNLKAETASARLILEGFFQRAEYYLPHRPTLQSWLSPSSTALEIQRTRPEQVWVHVRRSDYYLARSALDIGYYHNALRKIGAAPGNVYVVGVGIDDDARSSLAEWQPTYPALNASEAFFTLLRAPNLVISNSTFAWWPAFLGEHERVIAPSPSSGYWSPETARINLRVDLPSWTWLPADVIPFRPYRVQWRKLATLDNGQTWDAQIVTADGRTVRDHGVLTALKPLYVWMHQNPGAFGSEEASEPLRGTDATPVDIVRALKRLHRLGALDVDPAHESVVF